MYHTGDLLNALGVLNSVFLKPDPYNESSVMYEKAINTTVDVATSALQLPNLPLSSGHYELMFNTFSFALTKTENFLLKSKLLDLISRSFDKAHAMQSNPSMSIIRLTYSHVMNSFILSEQQRRNNITNDNRFLKDVRETFRKIKRAAASKMPLGSRVVLVAEHFDDAFIENDGTPVKSHSAITEIVHLNNAFDVTLHAKRNVNSSISAKVQFGNEVKQNYSEDWDCKQNMPCKSIIYSITIFPSENPFPVNKQAHKLSPVIDITLHAPNTGHEQIIQGLFKATVFELTVTGNETFGGSDYSTKCHYFDESRQEWRMDDVHPLGIAYNQAGCWSGHLSSFVVLRVVLGINADYIIGVLVACMMGVLVFGMMVVFYVQRKHDATVSPSVDEVKQPTSLKSANQLNLVSNEVRKMRPATEIQTKTILITD